MGGEDGCGGLLVVDPKSAKSYNTVLKLVLVALNYDEGPKRDLYDKTCVYAMKKLNEANLLTKDDAHQDKRYYKFRLQCSNQMLDELHRRCRVKRAKKESVLHVESFDGPRRDTSNRNTTSTT